VAPTFIRVVSPLHAPGGTAIDHVHVLTHTSSTPTPFLQVRQQLSVRQVCVRRETGGMGGREGAEKDRGLIPSP